MSELRPVGDLTLAEMRRLDDLRARTDAAHRRLGELEVERHRLVLAAMNLEAESAAALTAVAARLGIPDGVAWSVDRDGTVRVEVP